MRTRNNRNDGVKKKQLFPAAVVLSVVAALSVFAFDALLDPREEAPDRTIETGPPVTTPALPSEPGDGDGYNGDADSDSDHRADGHSGNGGFPVTIHSAGQLNLPADIVSPYPPDFGSPFDANGNLSNERLGWYFNRDANHQPPTAQRRFDIRTLNGHYLGDISQKVVYLTFDEGYEYGFTEQILDTLAEKNARAAFFVTLPYVKSQPELTRRMIEEGHIVANHSANHKSSPDLTDDAFEFEIKELERYFEENFHAEMGRFFRPPMGEYSARTLALADNLGYATIFWSFAYQDWLVDDQPGADVAYQTVMNNLHNGMIILLHAVSESNAQALPAIIDSVREQGYRFGILSEPQR